MRQHQPAVNSARTEPSPGMRRSEVAWAVVGAVAAHLLVLGPWAADRAPDGLRAGAGRAVDASAAPRTPLVSAPAAPTLSQRPSPVEVRSLPGPALATLDTARAPAKAERPAARAAMPGLAAAGAASAPPPPAAPSSAPSPARDAERIVVAGGQVLSAAPAAAAASAVTAAPAALVVALPSPPAAASAGPTADEWVPPPVYATRVPPPFRLAYALRRGALSGQAELSLQRTGPGYELELKGTALGLEVLGLRSQGSLGPHGLMPERFVDRRRGKDRLAANFDHGAGRITYSGSAAAQPLLPGAQDRLSWMVQLAAILEAAPVRHPAGSRIALSVSGARADVDTWNFIVQGRQRLSLPGGAVVEALRLTREPRRPYDTQVEVWMDPAQHHLPVRARLTVLPGGETLELLLQPA